MVRLEHREVFVAGSRTGGRLLDLAPLSRAEIDEQNLYNLAMAVSVSFYAQCRLFTTALPLRRRTPRIQD